MSRISPMKMRWRCQRTPSHWIELTKKDWCTPVWRATQAPFSYGTIPYHQLYDRETKRDIHVRGESQETDLEGNHVPLHDIQPTRSQASQDASQ